MNRKQISPKTLNPSTTSLSKVNLDGDQVYFGEGYLPWSIFPRLIAEYTFTSENLENKQAVFWKLETWVDLPPAIAEELRMKLSIFAKIPVICQRCMQVYLEPLEINSQFVFFDSLEQVEDFPLDNDVEDSLLKNPEFNVLDLIEEEILLACPWIPKHPDGECEIIHRNLPDHQEILKKDVNFEEVKSQSGKPNPFASLKKLKLNS